MAKQHGRSVGSLVTAVCTDCGAIEQASASHQRYRCAKCIEAFAQQIRHMAGPGMSQGQIAASLGISQNTCSVWCCRHGIVSRFAKPSQEVCAMVGFRKQAPKLMPSARALRLVSIFSMGA